MTDDEQLRSAGDATPTEQERRLRDDLHQVAGTRHATGDWADVVRRAAAPTLTVPAAPTIGRRRRSTALAVAAAAAVLLVGAVAIAGTGGDDPDRVGTTPGEATTTVATSATTPEPAEVPTTSSTTSTAAAPPTTTTSAPDLPVEPLTLRSAELTVRCPAGEVVFPPGEGAAAGGETVASRSTVRADLDGDGPEEAVFAVHCATPDGRGADSVVAVASEADGPRQLGGPVPGVAPVVVGDTVVTVEDVVEADGPSAVHIPYRLVDGRLVEGGGAPLTAADVATTGGLGAFRVGGTYAELAAALGQRVATTFEPDSGDSCRYVRVQGAPDGVEGLGDRERLRSITVRDPAVRTRSGLGPGSTEAEVRAAFPGRLQEQPHPFAEGVVLTLQAPGDPLAAVFVIEAGVVSSYAVGELAAAQLSEGCH